MMRIKSYPLTVNLKKGLSLLLSKMPFVLPDGYLLVNCPGGRMFLKLRESRMMMKRSLGVYEYEKVQLLHDLVEEGMTIVDVGVNKGYFSLLFAKLVHDNGTVLAFEPYPENCFWIKQNIDVNSYKCIKLFQCALSDQEGTSTFYLGKKSGFGSLFAYPRYRTNETITVQTRMLDNVLKEEGLTDVDLIKIDVEGADLKVLKGAQNLLRNSDQVKLVMDIDVRTNKEKRELQKFLTSCGFKLFDTVRGLKPIQNILQVEELYAVKHP